MNWKTNYIGKTATKLSRQGVSIWMTGLTAIGLTMSGLSAGAQSAPYADKNIIYYAKDQVVYYENGRIVTVYLNASGGVSTKGNPPTVSQVIGMTNSVKDEYGYVLPGTDPDADLYGCTEVQGDLVQILLAVDGVIYPPDTHGNPHPNNVVIHTTRIGLGQSPTFARSGKFGAAVSPRPDGNSKIFARVFNAAGLARASFYGNSQLFTVSSSKNTTFIAAIPPTTLPLDAADSNGDGVSNSLEKSLADDRDMDGVLNCEELLAGTDPKDIHSYLGLVSSAAADDHASLDLRWHSVPGRSYVIEALSGNLSDAQEAVPVANLQADSDLSRLVIPVDPDKAGAVYRVSVQTDASTLDNLRLRLNSTSLLSAKTAKKRG